MSKSLGVRTHAASPALAMEAARLALARARADGRAVILTASLPAPEGLPLDKLRPGDPFPRVAWSDREGACELAGAGAALVVEAAGPAAPGEAVAGVLDWLPRGIHGGPGPIRGPTFLGGAAFDPGSPGPAWAGFPGAWFVLPRVLYWRRGAGCGVSVNQVVEPDAAAEAVADRVAAGLKLAERLPDPRPFAPAGRPARDPQAEVRWSAAVNGALAEIAAGRLSKVVLARSVAVSLDHEFDAVAALRALSESAGDCFRFLLDRGDSAFFGASPERLLRVEGDQVIADCIAGTAPRGRDPAEDRDLARRLAASEKELREHRHVADWVRGVLARHCTSVQGADQPEVLSLATLHHLSLPVRGTLRADADLGQLLGDLHPTPAVGGSPQQQAREFIRSAESEGRGWYAGPVGVIEPGRAEFAVAIRSALVGGRSARVFTGGGIVEGSRPQTEWLETEAKAAQLVSLLSQRQP